MSIFILSRLGRHFTSCNMDIKSSFEPHRKSRLYKNREGLEIKIIFFFNFSTSILPSIKCCSDHKAVFNWPFQVHVKPTFLMVCWMGYNPSFYCHQYPHWGDSCTQPGIEVALNRHACPQVDDAESKRMPDL